jgi:prepilin-type N-terminal cleavage/methylation domain-containing protein
MNIVKNTADKKERRERERGANRFRALTQGFTLIELLVVVAIISLLSSVVLASLSGASESARDARRKVDLEQIQTALELYYNNNRTYQVLNTGSGGGSGGWFNYEGGSYPKSVAQGLVDAGVVGSIIIDPSGEETSNSSDQTGYMIRAGRDHYTVWANLENPSDDDRATLNTCYYDSYDNYKSSYSPSARINYCVSN